MTEVFKKPKTGQFVAVWTHGWEVWSGTFRYEDGELFNYEESQDKFIKCGDYIMKGARFFTIRK
jgi:hypothetical protein